MDIVYFWLAGQSFILAVLLIVSTSERRKDFKLFEDRVGDLESKMGRLEGDVDLYKHCATYYATRDDIANMVMLVTGEKKKEKEGA